MSKSDVKIEKPNCSKSIHISKQSHILQKKLSLIKACSLKKENSRELLDC